MEKIEELIKRIDAKDDYEIFKIEIEDAKRGIRMGMLWDGL